MSQLLQHLINGLASGTIYALVALGYTMVYGVLKLINFAHGDVMMVGVYMGYATAFALGRQAQKSLLGVVIIFLVAMGGCALLGFLIERFAYRPLREKPRLTALITAIGISFALSYGFQLDIGFLPGAAPRAFPEVITPTEWLVIGDRDVVVWNWQVLSLLIAVGLMVGLQWLVFKTRFGRAMRAVSFDHRVAALMGIPTDRVIAVTFMIGSALAAGAGLLYAIKESADGAVRGTQGLRGGRDRRHRPCAGRGGGRAAAGAGGGVRRRLRGEHVA
jgi:branched-chain amino acid transport system permease protein